MLATERSITVGATQVRTELKATPREATLESRAGSLRSGRRLYLVVRGLRVDEEPGIIYHLYLDLPAGAKPLNNDPRYVGSINFYGVPPAGTTPSDRVYQSFDITDAVRTLQARGLLRSSTTVTLFPVGPAAPGAKAIVGRLEIVEQ